MRRKISSGKIFDFFNIIIMLFVIVCTLYPFLYVVMASFSDPTALSTYTGLLLLPIKPYTFEAYKAVFSMPLILSGFKNTLFVLIVGVLVNMVFTILGAYFLSIKGPMLKDVVAFMIIFTMYFSGGMIPGYLNVKDLGLINSLWALILPGAIGTSNLIIMKSAFLSVPDSLVESARLDGASYIQTLTKVMLPLTKATLAVLVLYYGVGHWNSWFGASIYLQDKELYPIQLILRNLLASTSSIAALDDIPEYAELVKYALIVITSAPIICLYPFLQKYFTKGVMMGAVKG